MPTISHIGTPAVFPQDPVREPDRHVTYPTTTGTAARTPRTVSPLRRPAGCKTALPMIRRPA